MSLELYSTLSRSTEEFTPLKENAVGIYSCGVTTYDEIHLGHARQAIVFDIIRNYFEHLEYEVCYVRNHTDIDDKIINRANEQGKKWSDVSEYYINESQKDLERLKVKPATFEPKVTEHIQDITEFIQALIDKGVAYPAGGDVFLDVTKVEGYGKLSNRNIDELVSEKTATHKRNIQDFSLWKGAKEGEPYWESPWGNGRPGWHIECSVLAYKYLGERLDIHGGGIDLLFPHHENEIAQSEAFSGKQFANYWMHNGLVQINGQKMSKSLGNFLTVKDMLTHQTADEIRFMVILHNYATQIDFSDELFVEARKRVYYFYKTLKQIRQFASQAPSKQVTCPEVIENILHEFESCMNDNFNTARVVSLLSRAFSKLNEVLEDKNLNNDEKAAIFAIFESQFEKITNVLKLLDQDPDEYISQLEELVFRAHDISRDEVMELIKERIKAREEKNYEQGDKIRDQLKEMKVAVKDNIENKIDWDLIFD